MRPPAESSGPSYPGDDWHELRAAQLAVRTATLRDFAADLLKSYTGAATVLDSTETPEAEALRTAVGRDLFRLDAVHDYLAAHWRSTLSRDSNADLDWMVFHWQAFLLANAEEWTITRPALIRRLCLRLIDADSAEASLTDVELWDELTSRFPLPPARGSGR